ncbi:GNAT family N-acetyltransferase [Pelagibius sp.]|uniref:GNAT family N-acetyltransferase n=1 Tax=Pelagibius sp. TaxID=1931238 RepID=UPI003B50243D
MSFGLFAGGRAVELISLVDPRLVEDTEDREHFQSDCLFVWRVMVDRTQQGRGYGTQAIHFACNYARLVGLQGVSLTTMDQEAGNALPFYERLGFHPTGRRLDGEIELVRRA